VSDCNHPRSQTYDTGSMARCGACGDGWSDELQGWFPVNEEGELMVPAKTRVIIVDVRNNHPNDDGTNLDVPEEGRQALMDAIEHADVLVEVGVDSMWVREGANLGLVTLVTTKSESQMSIEKALREKHERLADKAGDVEAGEHPVTVKFSRVWDPEYLPSGKPVEGGLKGY